MYAIQASITYMSADGFDGTRSLPTFYLDENVQGFMDARGARRIATYLLDPFGDHGDRLHVTAVRMPASAR